MTTRVWSIAGLGRRGFVNGGWAAVQMIAVTQLIRTEWGVGSIPPVILSVLLMNLLLLLLMLLLGTTRRFSI